MQTNSESFDKSVFINSIKKLVESYIFNYYANNKEVISLTPDITKSLKEQTSIVAHNSMSNNFFKNIPWLNNILNNQDLSITQMLKMGIRSLDLDVFNGNMNPLHQTNYEQVAHSIGNHDYRIPINIPGKLIDYLKEIKKFIDDNNPKEPILIFLENYNNAKSIQSLNDEILKVFEPSECYKAPLLQISMTPLNQVSPAKVVFLAQNYEIPQNSILNKGNYNALFSPYGETSIPYAESVNWNLQAISYRLSLVNSDSLNKFGHEEVSKAIDNKINLIKVDNIVENDLRFIKPQHWYEMLNSKEMLFLPAAILGAIMVSEGLPEQSKEKFIMDLVLQVVLPFNGKVVYNVTKKGIESFDPTKQTKENILNILKSSIKSIFSDSVSQAMFNYGIAGPAFSPLINLGLNIAQGMKLDEAFYKAIDSSTLNITSFASDVPQLHAASKIEEKTESSPTNPPYLELHLATKN